MIKLQEEDRIYILSLLKDDNISNRIMIRCSCLILSESNNVNDIAKKLRISVVTVRNIQKRYTAIGLHSLYDKIKKKYESKKGHIIGISDTQKEKIFSLATSEPPYKRKRWSLRLLRKFIIQTGIAQQISHETVRYLLQQKGLNFGDWFNDKKKC